MTSGRPHTDGDRVQTLTEPPKATASRFETEGVLTPQEREIVALAASFGSGCHPCVAYHVDASRKAGLGNEQLVEIVLRAHGVAVVAADRIARDGLRLIQSATDGHGTNLPAGRANELAALGAAIAANSMPDIEECLAVAAREGLTKEQLAQAASVAHEVQANAASIHARKTARLLQQTTSGEATGRQPLSRPEPAATSEGLRWAAPEVAEEGAAVIDQASGNTDRDDHCACHEEVSSSAHRSARSQAGVRAGADRSPSGGEVGPAWGSMRAMIGKNPATLGSCCAPAIQHDAADRASDPAEPGCDCAADATAHETTQL
jgi:AhpD family alkylhydroperoxidase